VTAQGSAEDALKQKVFELLRISPASQRQAGVLFSWGCLMLCAALVLSFSIGLGMNLDWAVHTSNGALLGWTSQWVPWALVFISAVIPVVTVFDAVDAVLVDTPALLQGSHAWSLRRPAWVTCCGFALAGVAVALLLLRAVACQRLLAAMPGPLAEIAPSLRDPSVRVSLWGSGIKMYHQDPTMPLGLPHYGPYPYGLFRAMTGIGPDGEVARPEIVIEVQEAQSGMWHELQFPYKPGDIHRRPPVVAPYQPRLDWQMWFQALTPFPEPWFESLLQHILQGTPAVLSLLDVSSLPDKEVSAVRALGYTYNFTGYGQPGWWRRAPAEEHHFYGPRQASKPVNLMKAVAVAPRDWRLAAVWVLLGTAALLWLAPCGFRLCLAWSQGRLNWWQAGASDADRKDA